MWPNKYHFVHSAISQPQQERMSGKSFLVCVLFLVKSTVWNNPFDKIHNSLCLDFRIHKLSYDMSSPFAS